MATIYQRFFLPDFPTPRFGATGTGHPQAMAAIQGTGSKRIRRLAPIKFSPVPPALEDKSKTSSAAAAPSW